MKLNKNSEEYRSPSGFRDRYGVDCDFDYYARKVARRIAYQSCYDPLTTTPLGFLSTFEKERMLDRERIYPLSDLSGRKLVLAPDSTASVLRWLCENGKSSNYSRLMFTSPVFRYRRNKYKHTYHLGYVIANEKRDSKTTYNQALITLVTTMFEFFSNFDKSVKIKVTDFSIWHTLLEMEFQRDEERKNILYQLRFKDFENKKKYIEAIVKDNNLRKNLMNLLDGEEIGFENILQQCDQWILQPIIDFKDDLERIYGIEVSFDLNNFHGSEVQNSIAFQFYSSKGTMLGDGGCYTDYARKFNSNINSFFSTATSVEYLGEVYPNTFVQSDLKVCLIYIDDQSAFAKDISDKFKKAKIPVFRSKINKNISKNINPIKNKNSWYCILNKNKDGVREITLKHTITNRELKVDVNKIHSLGLDDFNINEASL